MNIGNGDNQNVYYPQVVLSESSSWQYEINQAIIEQVKDLITLQTGNIPTSVEQMLGFYEIKNNQRNILSLALSNYTYHFHAAHGMTYIKSLTFDFNKEKLVQLEDLFIPGSNYVEVISNHIQQQIEKRNIQLLDDFTTIQPQQDFYIADKTLVIYFQLYEITPYVEGLPMFPISVFDLMDSIDENSPLSRLAINN